MFELSTLAYIDLQKTGSTTIASVLREIVERGPPRRRPHGPVPRRFSAEKPTFISIREPLALCASLFAYGAAENRGQLYANLMRKGYPGLYEPNVKSFERWLDFFTDPNRAGALGRDYSRYSACRFIGLLSFRLLFMSIRNPRSNLRRLAPGRAGIRRLLKHERVYTDYVRTEHLGPDLFAFLVRNQHALGCRDQLTTAENLIAMVPIKNASTKIEGVSAKKVSAELKQRVREREWLIYKEFGYDQKPDGLSSIQNPRFAVRD